MPRVSVRPSAAVAIRIASKPQTITDENSAGTILIFMSPCRTLEGLSRKMCERLHTSLVVQKMQLGQKTRWHWRGIGPRCAGIPRSLAAADEEELPKMPSTRFPRPLGAAGGRADHQPLRSRQNLLWQDL